MSETSEYHPTTETHNVPFAKRMALQKEIAEELGFPSQGEDAVELFTKLSGVFREVETLHPEWVKSYVDAETEEEKSRALSRFLSFLEIEELKQKNPLLPEEG